MSYRQLHIHVRDLHAEVKEQAAALQRADTIIKGLIQQHQLMAQLLTRGLWGRLRWLVFGK